MEEERSSDTILTKSLPEISLKNKISQEPTKGLFSKFKSGFLKTKNNFVGGLRQSLTGDEEIDEDLMDRVEEELLSADLGVATARSILKTLEADIGAGVLKTRQQIFDKIRKIIETVLDQEKKILRVEEPPLVIMLIGVNGVGKTTTIGKLAAKFCAEKKKVLVAAGDTFRAAAINQLQEWAMRAKVDFISKEENSDPASVMFEASQKARDENYDVLLCDTSGRLHTKKNLMDELAKMKRVMKKNIPNAPHYTLLVLDANTGQNALSQTKDFSDIIGINGLVLTKLDGTAKGGVLIGIANEFSLPVYYVGLGEKIDDLQEFDGKLISEGLFSD